MTDRAGAIMRQGRRGCWVTMIGMGGSEIAHIFEAEADLEHTALSEVVRWL